MNWLKAESLSKPELVKILDKAIADLGKAFDATNIPQHNLDAFEYERVVSAHQKMGEAIHLIAEVLGKDKLELIEK